MKVIFTINDEALAIELGEAIANEPGIKTAGLRVLQHLILKGAITAEIQKDEQKK